MKKRNNHFQKILRLQGALKVLYFFYLRRKELAAILMLLVLTRNIGSAQLIGEVISPQKATDFPYVVSKYGTKHGLKQNLVQFIIQLPLTGGLLMGNAASLLKFDGNEFSPQNFPYSSPRRIFLNNIFPINNGKFLLGYYYEFDHSKRLILFNDNFVEIGDSTFALQVADSSWYYTDQEGKIWEKQLGLEKKLIVRTGIKNPKIIHQLSADTFIIGDNESTQLAWGEQSNQHKLLFEGQTFLIKYLPRRKEVWMRTYEGIYKLTAGGVVEKVQIPIFADLHVSAMTEVGDDVFISTYDGLFIVSQDTFYHYHEENVLPTNLIKDICYDEKSGVVFLGTENQGLLKLTPKYFKYNVGPGTVYSKSIQSIQKVDDERIWGVTGGGLIEWQHDSIKLVLPFEESPTSLNIIGDTIVIGTWNGNAYIGSLSHLSNIKLRWDWSNGILYGLHKDSAGYIWALTSKGLERGKSINQLKPIIETKKQSDFCSFFESRHGEIWIGGYRKLYKFDKLGNILKEWSVKDGLKNAEIRSFYEDSEGVVWIGSHGEGLFAYSGDSLLKLNEWRNYGLGKEIFTLAPDKYGNLLITTNNGLISVSLSTLKGFLKKEISHLRGSFFGEEEGMINAEFNGRFNGRYLTFDRESFYFPTLQGMVKYTSQPIEINDNTLHFTNVLVDDVPVPGFPSIFTGTSGQIKFQFSKTNFLSHKKIKYQYQLKKNNKTANWSALSFDREVQFLAPEPGKYMLFVRAVDAIQPAANNIIIYEFEIVPPFYQSIKFLFLSGLFLFVALFYSWRFWYASKQRKIQKSIQGKKKINELQLIVFQARINQEYIFEMLLLIQRFIQEGKLDLAEEFLIDFSRGVRMFLENNKSILVPLSKEATLLNLFIEMEKTRLQKEYKFEFSFPSELSSELIPTLIYLPFLTRALSFIPNSSCSENYHYIRLSVKKEGNKVITLIEDNRPFSDTFENDRSEIEVPEDIIEQLEKKIKVLKATYKIETEIKSYLVHLNNQLIHQTQIIFDKIQ